MLITDILVETYKLKDKILNSKEYKDLKEKEKLMEENARELLMQYENLKQEYNHAIRFSNYGSDTKQALKNLQECKIKVNNNEYVKEYNLSYKKMIKLLFEIEKTLFKDIKEVKDITKQLEY